MKKASGFEIVAARCWNLLNEGKPFTPIFIVGTILLYKFAAWGDWAFWLAFVQGIALIAPLLALTYFYDFPLFLRNYLWLPVVAAVLIWGTVDYGLLMFAIGLYFFFTVFFWGTIYYHLRIGTTWLNFTRFWKLVLKNSDSTSGNAQEQLPKFILLLHIWSQFAGPKIASSEVVTLLAFTAGFALFAWVLHHYLFDWKPKAIAGYTAAKEQAPQAAMSDKVVVLVVDGMRKERFEDAKAPFMKKLRAEGTEYLNMETVYPARTVVCFSSMFTGTYPFEHGIQSNMVWKLGIRVESIFDSLRKVGKVGRLLGIAHLIDSMGDDVESVTAVMHNDKADRNIMERAKLIMAEQDPDLLVVQFIGTDQTGHSRGVLYPDYVQKIEEVDALIEEYVTWLTQQGKMANTTLILCADHGQADGIGGHGHLDEGERYVPFFMWGPSIQAGLKVQDKHSLVSLAPTLSVLLGAPYPSHSRGPVLREAIIEK